LEGYAAERAAKRVSPEELEKLSTYCDEMRSLIHKLRDGEGDPVEHNKRMNELDYHFHSVTICAAGNRKIMKIVADQRVLALVTTSVIAHPERPTLRKLSEIWQSHLRVLRALRRGDGASARRWMERHIEKAKQRALRQYDEANPPCAASEQRTQAVLDMIEKLERYEG
ncbi:MAG TPA: FCD domain-containing protein, partial [Gemmatimonadaceae bacterium]